MKSITDTNWWEKLLKEKKLDVPKVVKQIQQTTYHRRNKNITLLEALTSNRDKLTDELLDKTTFSGKKGTTSRKTLKERNCRKCNATKWNFNHKCKTQESICYTCKKRPLCKTLQVWTQKTTEICKQITEPKETTETDTDKSTKKISQIKLVTEQTNQITKTKKMRKQKNDLLWIPDHQIQKNQRMKKF